MKVSHKARSGRYRTHPEPHRSHRHKGAISDPITRAMKRMAMLRRREDEARFERAAGGWPL